MKQSDESELLRSSGSTLNGKRLERWVIAPFQVCYVKPPFLSPLSGGVRQRRSLSSPALGRLPLLLHSQSPVSFGCFSAVSPRGCKSETRPLTPTPTQFLSTCVWRSAAHLWLSGIVCESQRRIKCFHFLCGGNVSQQCG